MSLARTALRLATLEALRPSAAVATKGPWPTLAGVNVLDSRIDPIEDLKPAESRPIVCVYTDLDEGTPGQRPGGPPFKQIVDLVFELSVVVRVDDGNDPQVYEAGIPETDGELESSLDLLEAQIKFWLLFGTSGSTALVNRERKTLWRAMTGCKVSSIHSMPHRTSEEAVRLARRTVTWKVQVLDDCYDPAPPAGATGLDRLPQPLRAVVEALASTSYGAKIGAGLADGAPAMPVAQPLHKVEIALDTSVAHDGQANIKSEVDVS
jgi:hypothetical protein